jgi:fatty acid synthase subunit alpha, fungi type
MVLPGDELTVDIRHIGMRDDNIVVNVETVNGRGEKILQGSAEVAQPTTVYVFTVQGSQEPDVDMDLYKNSPAAHAVWDGADAHLLAIYGSPIVEIVKDNPKEKTIHFGGIKGQAIRKRYMEMTFYTTNKGGTIHTLPLFGDINVPIPKYAFSHPSGLLFSAQFAQIAVVECAFTGHFLGE